MVAKVFVWVVFGGLSVMLLYMGVTQFFLQRQIISRATPIEATIVKSEVFASISHDTDRRLNRNTSTTTYRPDVLFTYKVNGIEYQSDMIYPTVIVTTSPSREAAAEEIAPFPVGKTVQAFVDLQHPDKAFLVAEKTSGPVVFMIVGVLLIPVIWAVTRYVL